MTEIVYPVGMYTLDAGPEVQPVYTPEDLAERGVTADDIGRPGEYPFTRGLEPDGLRTRPTLVKIYSGLGTPEESNARFRKLGGWGVRADVRRGANSVPSALSVPSVLEAVRGYATVGEIADVFRDVLGEWQPDQTF